MNSDPITFSELDKLCDLDPLHLTIENLDRLIAGIRAYRANARAQGKATKFSDEAGITLDITKIAKSMNLSKAPTEKIGRRLK